MARVNDHYLKLRASYLFSETGRRVREFQATHPDAKLIRLGIGDVTQPLPPTVIRAMHEAVDEMGRAETFRGYPPETGWDFLLDAIVRHDYGERGIKLAPDEIVVSDGAKSDTGNIQEIFGPDCVVALSDPVYPAYLDVTVMGGRAGSADQSGRYDRVVYLPCTAENNFQPRIPDRPVDLIYLCFPNNPTGAVLTRAALKTWGRLRPRAERRHPVRRGVRGIHPRPGSSALDLRDRGRAGDRDRIPLLLKTAGFTGTRCAYTVVPKELQGRSASGEAVSLNALWVRRQSTKFNGVAYVIQRAAASTYTVEGRQQVKGLVDHYMNNARIIREGLETAGLTVYGGRNAPYIWVKTPGKLSSWDFFDKLLREAHVVGTPGAGFGPSGEGYFRLTAFGARAAAEEAVDRIKTRLILER